MSTEKSESVTFYRVLSIALAICVVVVWIRGKRDTTDNGATHVEAREKASALPVTRALALRQLRASAASFGISEDKLIAQLRGATNATRITMLCERLGFVGTDRALDALTELADDRRSGVPNAALKAIGQIGTDSAVRFLLGFEESGIPRHRSSAISALGTTGSTLARDRLTEIALSAGDGERTTAIGALSDIGGSDVVETLAAILDAGVDYYTARTIIRALSDIDQDDAQSLLIELAGHTDPRIRAEAIDYLEFSGREETQAVLLAALGSSDAEVAGIAAKTLARQGVVTALPRITTLALRGPRVAQLAAIEAISILGSDGSHDLLAELLETGAPQVRTYAASALAELGDDDAIDILVSASARSGTREAAVYALRDLRGPRVESAMIAVASSGRTNDRSYARQYLLDVGHPRGLELVIDAARNAVSYERSNAISTLADINNQRTRDALMEIATSATGDAKMEAITALVTIGVKEDARDLLKGALESGDKAEMNAAAAALVKLGDEAARDSLFEALKSGHGPTAQAAASVVLELDSGDEMRAALLEAAEINPEVRLQVIEKLVEEGSADGLALARRALANGDELSDVSYALARSDNPDARKLLIEAAGSGDKATRAQIASALSFPETPDATAALTRLASDEDAEVRRNALGSLGSVANDDAIETLMEIAESREGDDRRNAIEALGRADSGRARESIAELIERGADADALAAIGSGAGGGRIGEALVIALEDLSRSDEVRKAAAEHLKYLGIRVTDSQAAAIARLVQES